MTATIPGIHHVTAITADAQKNIDFYCKTLGLRLVKLTVNFDDPSSYHLYYGDDLGRPGTILTFFAWPGGYRGRIGPPQVTTTSFAAPATALEFWSDRLQQHGVQSQRSYRFGDSVLRFVDPDGLQLEIVGVSQATGQAIAGGPVSAEHSLRGFHSVTLSEEGYENTAKLLTEVMGCQAEGSEVNRFRYRIGGGGPASIIDVLCAPGGRGGSVGAGAVHHVAFRTPDDAQQDEWRRELVRHGFNVSPVMDRTYFHSIYYREPGGVLFEIATDSPGFSVDEASAQLGRELKLPEQYEPFRARLEEVLPRLQIPQWRKT